MKRTTITLPDELATAVAREAHRRRLSVSQIARGALAAPLGPPRRGPRAPPRPPPPPAAAEAAARRGSPPGPRAEARFLGGLEQLDSEAPATEDWPRIAALV